MRVLFIIHDNDQEDNHFPLGIAYMASILRTNGHQVKVLCQDIYHFSDDFLKDFLDNTEWDIIGLGFMAARYVETIRPLCKLINEHKKNAWLVLGGHGPSPISEYVRNDVNADVVIVGEGEDVILSLVEAKAAGRELPILYGTPIKDLDSLPDIIWNLFPMHKYTTCCKFPGQDSNEKSLAIITGRGCVGECSFCYRMCKGIRSRSIDSVIDEIIYLKSQYDVDYFVIYDELFAASKGRIKALKYELDASDIHIKFSCNARVDIFDEDVAGWLKEMGCCKLNVGFESMDQNVLNLMGKRTTIKQNIKCAEIAKKFELNLGLNLIWGCPGDTKESLDKAVDFLHTYNTYGELRTIRPVTPYPGSPLYDMAIGAGLLRGPDDFFNRFTNSDRFTVNFTELDDDTYYQCLYKANKALINDHYSKTGKDVLYLINEFDTLYFKDENYKFRGSRHHHREATEVDHER